MRKKNISDERQKMITTLSMALPNLREELGVSQSDLAEKVGMSRNMISLIENGKQDMTWTQFLAIVFFLKTNNDFKKKRSVAKRYPNLVEQLLLLDNDMNDYKKQ